MVRTGAPSYVLIAPHLGAEFMEQACAACRTPLIDDDRCSYHLLLVCVTPCSRTLFCLWSLSLLTNVSNFALRMGGILGNLKFS